MRARAAPSGFSQAFDHRWGGLIHDAFTIDGLRVWLVEDGGRIRRTDNPTATNPTWTYLTTPAVVQDTLRRIFFLDSGDHGWAVGTAGHILYTSNGGDAWSVLYQMPAVLSGASGGEDLWDVHFFTPTRGYLLGCAHLAHDDRRRERVGMDASLNDSSGNEILEPGSEVELYAFDILAGTPTRSTGLAWPSR